MSTYTQLVVAVVVVLVAATLAGRLLKRRHAPHAPHPVIDNMNTRIGAWWVIAALVGPASWFGATGLALLFAAASIQGIREYLPSMQTRPRASWAVAIAAIVVQYALALSEAPIAFILLLPICVIAILVQTALGVLPAPSWRGLPGALLLSIYCVSRIPALASLDVPNPGGSGIGPALFGVIVVQASGVMQYIIGNLVGRHAIAPRLSPGKTIEGAVGGLLGAGLLVASLATLTPYDAATAGALGVLLCALGIARGLMFSAMKRRRGIKDWGEIIPGQGGVLDRLDSLCLSAPVFYHLLRVSAVG